MNSLVDEYRKRVPSDPRSDDELTLLLGKANSDGRYNRFPDFVQDYARLITPEPEDKPPISAELRRGISRGVDSLKSSAIGIGALGADLVGAEGTRDSLLKKYQEIEANSVGANAPGVARIEDIGSVGDAARYVLGKGGELIPNAAEAILMGAAGAAAGSAVGPEGTLAGGAGGLAEGFFARQSAKALLKTGLEKIVGNAAGRAVVKEQLEKIAAREAVGALAPATEQLLKSEGAALAARYGATAANLGNFGAIGAGMGFGTAATNPEVSDDDARAAAVIAGIGSAAGAVLPSAVIARYFPSVGHEVASSYVKRLAVEAAKEIPLGAVANGVTEVANIAAERYADPKKRNLPITDEELSRILNASVVGAGAGAVAAPFAAIPGPKQTFSPEVEAYIGNVPEARRQEIAQLKGRLDTSNPSLADEAALRSLNTEESAFYTVAEPVAGSTATDVPPIQGEEVKPLSTADTSTVPAGAAATASASNVPDPAAVARASELIRQATEVLSPARDDAALASAKAKLKRSVDKPSEAGTESPGASPTETSIATDAAARVAGVRPDTETISKGGENNGKINEERQRQERLLKESAAAKSKPDVSASEIDVGKVAESTAVQAELPKNVPAAEPKSAPEQSISNTESPARKSIAIKPEDVDVENRGTYLESGRGKKGESATVQPAWFVPKTQDHAALSKQLLSDSSPPSGQHRNSETYRQTAILDNQTGSVHVVSTFENNKQARVTKFTDDVGPKQGRAKSLSLSDVLRAKMEDGKARYEVIGSARSKELTEYVHDQYPDLATFQKEFSNPIEQRQSAVQSSAAAMGAKLEQAKDYGREEATTEHPETGEFVEAGAGGESMVDYQEPPMAESINLDAGEVRTLVQELPNFDDLVELAEHLASPDISNELRDVLKKVARQDPHFFERVLADGLETVLKDYGHEIESSAVDAGKSGSAEQSPARPKETGVRPVEQRSEVGSGDPAPVVAEQQNRAGQTQGAERIGEEGTRAGNQVADQSGRAAVALRNFLKEDGLDAEQIEDVLSAKSYDAAVEAAKSHDVEFTDEADAAAREMFGQQIMRTTPSGWESIDSSPENQPADPEQARLLQAIHEAAAAAGIDVKTFEGGLPKGFYTPENRMLQQVVSNVIGRLDVHVAIHEITHDVFHRESPEVQARLLKAIDRVTDDALGLGLSPDPRIRANDPSNLGKTILHEERLVESTTMKLVQEGFDPAQAKGFAQTFVRSLKDMYLRAAMTVQRMLGFKENPELAHRYFENRVKRLLAGDSSRHSYLDFIGFKNPSAGTRREQWFDNGRMSAERIGDDGILDYDRVADDSMASVKFNRDRALRFNLPVEDKEFSRSVELEKLAAVLNHKADVVAELGKAIEAPLGKALKDTGKTPAEMVRWELRIQDPKELREKNLEGQRELDGKPIKFNREARPDDFKAKPSQDDILPQLYRNTQSLLESTGKMRVKETERIAGLEQEVKDFRENYEAARQQYTDYPMLLRGILKHIRSEAKDLFREIAGLSQRDGAISQQLKALDPKTVLADYGPVFQKLFTGDQLKGERLFSLMDRLANDKTIDFSKPISEIKDALHLAHTETGAPYDRLLDNSKEGRALLATVVAYAKQDARTMALIELRRMKDGTARAEIAKQLADLGDEHKKLMGGTELASLGQLVGTAKLTERLRSEYAKAQAALRSKTQALAKARQRIAIADAVAPVLTKELARLSDKIEARPDFYYHDGAIYNAVKPGMSSEEVAKARKVLSLDSTSQKPTKAEELEKDMLGMYEFIQDRKAQYAKGDTTAKDADYHNAVKQWSELAQNQTLNVKLGPASRLMIEMTLMPVGKRMRDAFGVLGFNVDRRINRFTAEHARLVKIAHERGSVNDRMERGLLKLMPNLGLESLRANVLNLAKNAWQGREAKYFAEIYADQPTKLERAVSKLIRQKLLQNDATRVHVEPVIDQLMPQLDKLIAYQHDTNQVFLDAVELGGTGVKDERLRVFNPATGEFETATRRHLAIGPRTFSQRLSPTFKTMINAIRNAGMGIPKDGGESAYALAIKDVASAYNEHGAEAARAIIQPFATHPEYYDQAQGFFRSLAEADSDSQFNAPALKDGTFMPADPLKVREALEETGVGDWVKFAERLYELHGGEGDKGEYVSDVLHRIDAAARQADKISTKYETSEASSEMGGIRGMSSDAFVDARTVEGLPPSWFDYHSFDQRNLMDIAQRISAQNAFGRNSEGLATDFDSAHQEMVNARTRLGVSRQKAERAMAGAVPESGMVNRVFKTRAKRKQLEQWMAKDLGWEQYDYLSKLVKRAPQWSRSVTELSDYFRRANSVDGTVRAWTRAAQTLGNLLVNAPSAAIYQLAQVLDFPLKWGVSPATLRATLETIKGTSQEGAATLSNAIGVQMLKDSEYHNLLIRLGQHDPRSIIKFRDTFDRLDGEGALAHGLRSVNELLGAGINPKGEKATAVLLRPLQPFIMSTMLADRGMAYGMWQLAGRYVMKGKEFYKANPELLSDTLHKLDAGKLDIGRWDRSTFEKLTQDMERWGLNYDQLVRDAMKQEDGRLFNDFDALRLHSMAMSEVSSQGNISTNNLGFYNNPVVKFLSPLLSWSFRRTQQITSLRLNTEGKNSYRALAQGMAGLAVVSAGGLAVSALAGHYFDDLLGKKANLKSADSASGILENLTRVGTFGLLGDVFNSVTNVGQGGQDRLFSVDQRVVAVSAMMTIQRALRSWINQGEADYAHVVRPLAMAAGGNGLLQYMQIANHVLDTPVFEREARTNAKLNAQNYLRVVGRELGMEVRTFSGGSSTPTPMTPDITRMELAAYAGDVGAFTEAYDSAMAQAKEDGKTDPAAAAKRAFSSRNPLRSVFRTPPSEAQYKAILASLPEDGRRDVSEAVAQFNAFAERIGARAFEGKAEKKAKAFKPEMPKFTNDQMRRRSVEALFSR